MRTATSPLPRVALINPYTQGQNVTATVRSMTTAKTRYAIALDPVTGKASCSCPAFLYGKGRLCKHLLQYAGNLVGELSPSEIDRLRAASETREDRELREGEWSAEWDRMVGV